MIGLVKRLWRWFLRPSVLFGQGLLLLLGLIVGIAFWGGFNTVMEATNTTEFCISCHEMAGANYAEYKTSVHYSNPAGVRVACPDCHVPKPWSQKIVHQVLASGEIWKSLIGTISTPEKFEAKRLEMAESVWAGMKATDSRECRNCHSFEAMNFADQSRRAREKMEPVAEGHGTSDANTCIDCHKGIAHKNPMPDDDE